ncbi:tetratricopeptide repeat protein [Chryseobacterium limigenitum]|uniref:Tetratricopeptide repeat-containing protein n=1 Tax=Chryseobacterium limigenitum TaxID=1612149 RepID=A0A1K2IJN4_9FLAO|nr:tetratricopeptide repeat protein [Chryseobacterium limigenitum]SFZ92661.1 Tetratricopeptide repeat-containing protein [Chryseobacterium limigenitum]
MKHLILLFLFILSSGHILAKKNDSAEHCDALIKQGIDALYKKDHSTSLEIFAEAQKIAEQNSLYQQQFITTNCIGLNYYQMSDYSTALDSYLEAYSIAVKYLKSDREMTVLNNIALVYLQQGKYKESEKHQKRAYDLATLNKDYIGIAIYAANLADLYNITHQLDRALEYVKIARAALTKKNNTRFNTDLDIVEAKNFLERKEYDNVFIILKPLLNKLKDKESIDHRISALLILSKAHQGKKQNDKALYYVEKSQEENLNYSNEKDIYNQFSSLYFSMGDYNKALQYKDSIITVKDSLSATKNQAMYQNSEIKIKLQDSQKELKSEKRLKFYIAAFCISLLALLSWLFRTLYLKNQQKRTIAERNQQIITLELKNKENDNLLLEQQIKEKETEALLEKEKLKNELESRNRKLAVNAIHIAQRNDKIEEYILKLKKNPEIIKNDQLSQQLDQLKLILTKEDSNDDDFLIHFEKINSKFIDNLKEKHPNLTLNDIRYISYIYMNLSTKEISSIFNITIEACRKRKERVSKKLNLINSNDLYSYLSNI